jgi:heme/copper-type cytochrome/quinol oxidase subunit 3
VATQTKAMPAVITPPGKVGVWWFLASEIPVFGGFMASYVLLRLGSDGWSQAAEHLNFSLALINTFVLLTSSLTMVLAFAAAEDGNVGQLRKYLSATILLGLVFLGIKAVEYTTEIVKGFTPAAGIFWSFYYGMTGLHALHVFAGIVVNGVLLIATLGRSIRAPAHRIELAGLYWHFVDIIWIFLFPLLYLT